MTNKLIKIFLIICIFVNTSCIPEFSEKLHPNFTKHLWENKTESEEVTNILISEDGKNVIMIGEKYHYIFNDESRIIQELLNKKSELNPTVIDQSDSSKKEHQIFYIKTDQTVTTTIKIRTDYDDKKEIPTFLNKAGFEKKTITEQIKNKKGEKLYLEGELRITGKIYRPDPNVNYDQIPSKLNKRYSVTLKYEHGFIKKAYSVPLTPITWTADMAYPFILIGTVVVVFAAAALVITTVGLGYLGMKGIECKVSSNCKPNIKQTHTKNVSN